jgi:hypothetical protein
MALLRRISIITFSLKSYNSTPINLNASVPPTKGRLGGSGGTHPPLPPAEASTGTRAGLPPRPGVVENGCRLVPEFQCISLANPSPLQVCDLQPWAASPTLALASTSRAAPSATTQQCCSIVNSSRYAFPASPCQGKSVGCRV